MRGNYSVRSWGLNCGWYPGYCVWVTSSQLCYPNDLGWLSSFNSKAFSILQKWYLEWWSCYPNHCIQMTSCICCCALSGHTQICSSWKCAYCFSQITLFLMLPEHPDLLSSTIFNRVATSWQEPAGCCAPMDFSECTWIRAKMFFMFPLLMLSCMIFCWCVIKHRVLIRLGWLLV